MTTVPSEIAFLFFCPGELRRAQRFSGDFLAAGSGTVVGARSTAGQPRDSRTPRLGQNLRFGAARAAFPFWVECLAAAAGARGLTMVFWDGGPSERAAWVTAGWLADIVQCWLWHAVRSNSGPLSTLWRCLWCWLHAGLPSGGLNVGGCAVGVLAGRLASAAGAANMNDSARESSR